MNFMPDQDFFQTMAQIAAREALPHFRTALSVENKLEPFPKTALNQGFDPVTEADRNTEAALRTYLRQQRPQDGIIGEEWGKEGEDRDILWIIDPIDGTRAYVAGLPSWGTLVGLTYKGRAIAGMMAQPYNGDLFFANQEGSFFTRFQPQSPLQELSSLQRLTVSQTTELDQASLFTTTPQLFEAQDFPHFATLRQKVRQARFGGDCYAFAMLAAGFIDLVIEIGLQSYDIVALIPIIEQAGGIVTCLDGSRPEDGGNIIAAATPQLYEAALNILRRP